MSSTRIRTINHLVERAYRKLVIYRGSQHVDQLLSAYGCIGNAIQLINAEMKDGLE